MRMVRKSSILINLLEFGALLVKSGIGYLNVAAAVFAS